MIKPALDRIKNGSVFVNSRADASVGKAGSVSAIDRWLMHSFINAVGNPDIGVKLWGGKKAVVKGTSSTGMVIHDRYALCRLLTNPLLHFGDDYSSGRIDIEGDLPQFLQTVYQAMAKKPKFRRTSDPYAHRRNQPNHNSIADARRNIHHHYDLGNDFYRLWLDDEMVYTCAYFSDETISLEHAQKAKMDLICRKLQLKPGQSVVEAGCGWGGLARHMARNYGVTVKAYNISREQIAYARQRCRDEGLDDKIEYVEDDYRNIAGSYDVFVSVGMLEHVGPDHYPELGRIIDRSLAAGGIGLIHTIGQNCATPMSPWFLKRLFPGSYAPTIREIMTIFEPLELTVLDLENLRLHYAKTCAHWLQRFEAHQEQIGEMFDEFFIRTWRLYLSGCIANFTIGSLQLFQILFSRHNNNMIPLTRAHLFEPVSDS